MRCKVCLFSFCRALFYCCANSCDDRSCAANPHDCPTSWSECPKRTGKAHYTACNLISSKCRPDAGDRSCNQARVLNQPSADLQKRFCKFSDRFPCFFCFPHKSRHLFRRRLHHACNRILLTDHTVHKFIGKPNAFRQHRLHGIIGSDPNIRQFVL